MRRLEVVCVDVGSAYGPPYVERLASMVRRHAVGPCRIRCFTDRPASVPEGVEAVDASEWGLTGWFNKLRLFDQNTTDADPFLYLDVSLVVKEDLSPIIGFGESRAEPVIAVRDWHYDSLNSCCMWICPGSTTQSVWDEYAAGKRYPTRLDSDQDFANAVLRPKTGALEFFPAGLVASYKALRRMNRSDPERARLELRKALIVKFHGKPKPHELVDPSLAARLAIREALRHPKNVLADWNFMRNEVRDWWR